MIQFDEHIFQMGWFNNQSSSYPSFHQEMEKSKNPMAAMMKIGQQLEAQSTPSTDSQLETPEFSPNFTEKWSS